MAVLQAGVERNSEAPLSAAAAAAVRPLMTAVSGHEQLRLRLVRGALAAAQEQEASVLASPSPHRLKRWQA